MKYAGIAPFAITLLAGFALGAFLTPVLYPIRYSSPVPEDTTASIKHTSETQTAQSESSHDVSRPPNELASILNEMDAFRRNEDIVAHIKSIPLPDMLSEIEEAEKFLEPIGRSP